MITSTIRVLTAALALLLAGCAAISPRADASFGQSVRATLASQVVEPAAVRNANPVAGVDGRAARAAQDHYERSFAKPETAAAPPGMIGTR